MKRRRSSALLRRAALALLVALPVATAERTAALATCTLDETEAVVALMGVVLTNRNCFGVADNKCPADSKCLSVLEHMVRKMPDCTAAPSLGPSQRARLQKLLDKCGPATPAPTTFATPTPTSAWAATTDATAQATAKAAAAAASRSDHSDSGSFIGETSTRSVASSPSTQIASTCVTGVVICAVAAANW